MYDNPNANLSQAYALYYRRKEDYENFFKSSLQFLAYTAPGDLSHEEKKDWSIKIGMAVFLDPEGVERCQRPAQCDRLLDRPGNRPSLPPHPQPQQEREDDADRD